MTAEERLALVAGGILVATGVLYELLRPKATPASAPPSGQSPTTQPSSQSPTPTPSVGNTWTATYTVQPGDTLSGIAVCLGMGYDGYKLLAAANGISPPYVIYVGQVLKVPQNVPFGCNTQYGTMGTPITQTGTTLPSLSQCRTQYPVLSTANQGAVIPCVKTIQATLNTFSWLKSMVPAGYFPLAVDGIYGPRTATVVQAFQRSQGITADGIVGPQTYQALAAPITPGAYSGPVGGWVPSGIQAGFPVGSICWTGQIGATPASLAQAINSRFSGAVGFSPVNADWVLSHATFTMNGQTVTPANAYVEFAPGVQACISQSALNALTPPGGL